MKTAHKILTIIIIVLGVLVLFTFPLLITGYSLDTTSESLFKIYGVSPFLTLTFFFISLMIKAILAVNTNWTKWTSFSLGLFAIVILNFLFWYGNRSIGLSGIIFFAVAVFFLLLICILPVAIKNHYWTKWLLVAICAFSFIISNILLIFLLKENHPLYSKHIVYYRNAENNNEFVASYIKASDVNDSVVSLTSQVLCFIKRTGFSQSDLNGKWIQYDVKGNVAAINVFKNGEVISSEPVVPEGATRVDKIEELIALVGKQSKNEILALNGTFAIPTTLRIVNKENFTFSRVINVAFPQITASEINKGSIVFENCKNLNIEGIYFTLYPTEATAGMLTFINCDNVKISNCTFKGNGKYCLLFDDKTKNVTVMSNNMNGYTEYANSILYGSNFQFNDNSYYQKEFYDSNTRLLIRGNKVNSQNISNQLCDAANNFEEYNFNLRNFPGIDINGRMMGMFTGNCLDFSYSSGLATFLRTKNRTLIGNDIDYGLNSIEIFTGIEPLLHHLDTCKNKWVADGLPKFSHINPLFVKFASSFIPNPTSSCSGHTWQEIYDNSYQRLARLMVESYLYLERKENMKELIPDYKNAANMDNVVTFLTNRFMDVLTEYVISSNSQINENNVHEEEGEEAGDHFYYDSYPSYYFGFWIRRNIDGSAPSIWTALNKVMQLYDKKWFDEKMSEEPMKGIN